MGGIETDSGRIIRKLKEDGFVLISVKGSHHKFRKDGKAVIVPHPRKDLPVGTAATLQSRQAGYEPPGLAKESEMRVYYAVVEQEGESAFGVSFPDLPSVFSAADAEEDIIANAVEALRLWAEDEDLPEPSAIAAIRARDDVREALAAGGFLARIPLIEDDTRVVRVNLTFEAGMLEAIDAEARRRGLTRTAFLASAARKEIEAAA